MSDWHSFPDTYRAAEVRAVRDALAAGGSVALLGLSGSGKSNLLGFLAHRCSTVQNPLLLVDCNRLLQHTATDLLAMLHHTLGAGQPLPQHPAALFEALDQAVATRLQGCQRLAILFDRFDIFAGAAHFALHNTLRALRDVHKYRLNYIFASRRPLPPDSELAELVQGHTLWLRALREQDARWNVQRYARRTGAVWQEDAVQAIVALSRGYPSLLKAACEAYAAGAVLGELAAHPAMQARVAEFWRDEPAAEQLRASDLHQHPLLIQGHVPVQAPEELTAYEKRLYDYLQLNAGRVCEKDELIRAVWPEDAVYEEGVRDSSLAQLVRRLRLKIEEDASEPHFIHTVPGRGYLFRNS